MNYSLVRRLRLSIIVFLLSVLVIVFVVVPMIVKLLFFLLVFDSIDMMKLRCAFWLATLFVLIMLLVFSVIQGLSGVAIGTVLNIVLLISVISVGLACSVRQIVARNVVFVLQSTLVFFSLLRRLVIGCGCLFWLWF